MSANSLAHSASAINQLFANMLAIQPNLPNIYASHQRSTSNPRAYAAPDLNAVGAEARRDDPAPGVYTPEEGYPGFQQGASYPAVNNVGYGGGYGNQSMSLAGYSTQSPASASRRTSGPKPASTPPASAPAGGANPSPGSRYYQAPGQQGTPDPGHHVATQSPYQPSSAPPQGGHHQPQPQTAHPYGGGYYNYYDQQQGQWQQHYNHGFAQPRPPASNAASGSERTPQTGSSGFDYSQYPGYAGHDRSAAGGHPQQWQTPTSARSGSGSIGAQGTPTQPWSGYPSHHQVPPQPMASHHAAQGQMLPGQYGWQQQWNPQGYGYPPITPHSAHPVGQPPNTTGVSPSGVKKEKKAKDEYKGLGKRPAEPTTEEESEDKKDAAVKGKKKGKKVEEEKPVPKPPAKSHLHPPRQAQSAWQLFFTDELNKAKAAAAQGNSPGGTPHHAKLNVAQIAKDAGIAYANLNKEQKLYYAQKVQESKDQYAKDLAVWQSTLTPEDIRAENAFRAQQRKEGKSRKGNLKDPNAPKKPLSAYFLFLKGIREDDNLRAKVWAEETETTKQSVLAAERWRSLSDEEKKPFLAQAEKDKQEYEAARKVYEDEAAARARGEDVPMRAQDPDPYHNVPKPVIHELDAVDPASTSSPSTAAVLDPKLNVKGEPMFGDFTHDSGSDEQHSDHVADQSIGIDEFQGFTDPLEGMDLGGFQGVSVGRENGEQEGEWGELTKLMGGDVAEEKKVDPVAPVEDVSVAPTLEEAVAESSETPAANAAADDSNVEAVAAAAEGEIAVPSALESDSVGEPTAASGIPTEEVSEQPVTSDYPPIVEETPLPSGEIPAEEPIAPSDSAIPEAVEEAEPTSDAPQESTFEVPASAEEPVSETVDAIEAPVPSLPLPEEITAQPATDATAEETVPAPEVESEVPAADGV